MEQEQIITSYRWIPVDRDDLPLGPILFRNAYGDCMVGDIETYFSTEPPFCRDEYGSRMDNITHWCILPEFP